VIAITLVTSVLNAMPYLGEMLTSAPADPRVEHIVIDAGSVDGGLALLAREPRLRVIARPGLPLYDAWNEGVAAAQGSYIWFLNADDRLAPNALQHVLNALAENANIDVLTGNADAFVSTDAPDTETTVWRYDGEALCGFAPAATIFGAALINAKLMRRDLILACGGFDTNYRYSADREFLLRLTRDRPALVCHHAPMPIYRYRIHRASMTLQPSTIRRIDISLEHQRVARLYLGDSRTTSGTRRLLSAWLAHERAVTALYGTATGSLDLASAAVVAFAREAGRSVPGLVLAHRIRRGYRRDLLCATATGSCEELPA
jgi:glycosyltransferase involved in cell wall biosynthesis